MRTVIQRVKQAQVKVDQSIVGSIEKGYLIYVGFHVDDTLEHVKKMADKIINLRVFEDHNQKMNLNLKAVKGSLLVVSQFTLYGDTKGNNRPSFTQSMPPTDAQNLYHHFINILSEHAHVEQGVFGAKMEILSINDGPVTIQIEM